MKSLLKYLLLFISFLPLNAEKTYIYRNDGGFNQIPSGDDVRLVHRIVGTDSFLEFGTERIPLNAIDSIAIRQSDVPVLRFTFPENPEAQWVTDKINYIPAILDVDGAGMTDSADGLELSVKGRGNASWGFPKKPMRLKFAKKTSICGMTPAKSYVLLADCIDQSLMRNATALWLAQKMGVCFANSFIPCQVWVNGKFAGAYLLTHKIGINKASVDIDETAGILFELSSEYDEQYKFRSPRYNLPVMVKDPDFDKLHAADPEGPTPDDRLALWQADFNGAESIAEDVAEGLTATDNVDRYFDMRSFVDYFIVYNIACNSEIGFPKSVYLFKEGLGDEFSYKFGPAWDFDVAFNRSVLSNGENEVFEPHHEMWVNGLFASLLLSSHFMPIYEERFNYFVNEVFPDLMEWMDSYSEFIEPLARLEGLKYPNPHNAGFIYRPYSTFRNRENVEELKTWIKNRVTYLQLRLSEGEPR